MAEARRQPLVHVSAVVLDGDRVLLVQEAKAAARGRWNLPGGHVEVGESIPCAASRELREETGLSLEMSWVVGVYTGPTAVRFVLATEGSHAGAQPGDEIMACRAITLAEFEGIPDEQLVSLLSAPILRRIARDVRLGKRYPIDLFVHAVR